MAKTVAVEVPEEDLAHLVYRVHGVFRGALFRALSPGPELGMPAVELLGYLHAIGPSTITEAAEGCRMAKSQLSLNVERLVEKGLAIRERDGEDRRIARVKLTARGEKALAKAYEGVRQRVEAFFAPLSLTKRKLVGEAFGLVAKLAEGETEDLSPSRPSPKATVPRSGESKTRSQQ
ncbi:MAG TPA: MarR family transcriptional regulator [Rectinemataceae bacterium]|nr:MarR family transcriptional regulator [Rectinemataceae bacterium]